MQEIKMENKEISIIQDNQQDLLSVIKTSHGPFGNGYTEGKCTIFLKKQWEHLQILQEKRKIHMLEKGKVVYRLVAKEQVTVSDLKNFYDVFTKQLEDFIQCMSELEKLPNPQIASIFLGFKQEAICMMRKMLEISLVLETQPDIVNYDANHHQIPTLLCLGPQCLSSSDISIVNCNMTVVSESDLFKLRHANRNLDTIQGLEGVCVEAPSEKKSKGAKNRSNEKPKAVEMDLGVWSIPKDKISISDKGSAHKDWLRLKFTMRIEYRGVTQNIMLLSLPFNIRKGSVQMYTFIGALMWYFYITENPYEDFKVKSCIPTSTFLKMVIARLEVIGRKLSSEEEEFFNDLLMKLSSERTSERTIELETVTKSPPSKQIPEPEKTPSTSIIIDTYGFFTWFYALVYTLDTSGYLHNLWLDGYIYALCGSKRTREIVKKPEFGYQVVIIRPSLSKIHNHQGRNINMNFSLFYKTYDLKEKVLSLSLMKDDMLKCGLRLCLTDGLSLKFIYTKGGVLKSIPDLEVSLEKTYQYHLTQFKKNRGPILAVTDSSPKHCSTCCCQYAKLNSLRNGKSQVKKVRIPSGNSDHISSSSDKQVENLVHKIPSPRSVHNPIEIQMTSSTNMTLCNTLGNTNSITNGTADSSDTDTESCISPDGNAYPDFNSIMSPPGEMNSPSRELNPMTNSITVSSTTNRDTIIASFNQTVDSISYSCSNEVIEYLTQMLQSYLPLPSPETTDDIVQPKPEYCNMYPNNSSLILDGMECPVKMQRNQNVDDNHLAYMDEFTNQIMEELVLDPEIDNLFLSNPGLVNNNNMNNFNSF